MLSLRASVVRRCLKFPSQSLRSYSVRVLGDGDSRITTISDLISTKPGAGEGLPVQVDAWVKNTRKSPALRFVDIGDGSCTAPLQAVMPTGHVQPEDMQFGTAVRIKGRWKNSEASSDTQQDLASDQTTSSDGQAGMAAERAPELQVEEYEVLGNSRAASYPIQKKYATPESMRNIPHLRMRTPLNSAMLRLRSDVLSSLSQFFSEQKFHQTHPPIITSSDCEGAGETFRVEAGTKQNPFSKKEQYLTVSSQLHLEAFAQAVGNVWAISPTFRAERSDTSRHLSEFYMLEAEMSFVDEMEEIMDFIQKMLAGLVTRLKAGDAWKELDHHFRLNPQNPTERRSMADLDSREILEKRWEGLLRPDRWPRITYTQAIELLQSGGSGFEHPPTWGKPLQSEHERYLAKVVGEEDGVFKPVFVTHYPQAFKAFYMRQSADNPAQGPVFDCFDLIVPDLGELAGGSMREHRLDKMKANMKLHMGKEEPSALDWYIDLRRWGSPPHGGFGIGFDRLLSYLTGVKSIRDIVAFPRLYGHIHC